MEPCAELLGSVELCEFSGSEHSTQYLDLPPGIHLGLVRVLTGRGVRN